MAILPDSSYISYTNFFYYHGEVYICKFIYSQNVNEVIKRYEYYYVDNIHVTKKLYLNKYNIGYYFREEEMDVDKYRDLWSSVINEKPFEKNDLYSWATILEAIRNSNPEDGNIKHGYVDEIVTKTTSHLVINYKKNGTTYTKKINAELYPKYNIKTITPV